MGTFLRLFLLAIILEFGATYHLHGLEIVSQTSLQHHVENNYDNSFCATINHHSNILSPFEILEKNGEEEIEEEENEKFSEQIQYFSTTSPIAQPYFEENLTGISHKFSFPYNIPLFVIFHSWKIHI